MGKTTKDAEREARIMQGAMPHERKYRDSDLPPWYGGNKEQWNADYEAELAKREEAGRACGRLLEDLCEAHDRIR